MNLSLNEKRLLTFNRANLLTHLRRLRLITLCFVPALVFSTACSTRTSSPVIDSSTSNFGGSNFGMGSMVPTNKQTTSSLSSAQNTNLFNTSLNSNELPNGSQWRTYGGVTSQQQSCYANGFNESFWGSQDNVYQSSASNTNSSGWTSSCLSSNQTGVNQLLSREAFYDLGINTYSNMNYCLEVVLAAAPQNGQNAEAAHRVGAMALTRCYMALASELSGALPWMDTQQQVYQSQNENLRVLLFLLSGER